MKTCPLFIGMAYFLAVLSLACPKARADDGLSTKGDQSAMKAGAATETNSSADKSTSSEPAPKNHLAPPGEPQPPLPVSSSDSAKTAAAPAPAKTDATPTSDSAKVAAPTPETGIKSPPGVPIKPVPQDAGVSNPVAKVRPQQEDYHAQQTP